MAEWLAPFRAPKFTSAEFVEVKRKYNEKYGYQVTFPGLDDILHVGQVKPMTDIEKKMYKKRMWSNFSRYRLKEIMEMKHKKRQRYLQMLASPTPNIVRNAGSIMTCLDDAQDAISTLAAIGKIVVHYAPRVLGRFLAGPVNALMGTSDLINLVSYTAPLKLMPKEKKRKFHAATSSNPFSKKARLRRGGKIGDWKPGVGDALQALQTTDGIFGIGLSLGPILGIFQDIVSGGVRMLMGDHIKVNAYPPPFNFQERMAMRTMKQCAAVESIKHDLPHDARLELYVAGLLGQQVLHPIQQIWNPLETIENLDDIELIAPQPFDPLTLDIMAEEHTPVEEYTGWPFNGKQYATVDEIREAVVEESQANLRKFIANTSDSWDGFSGGGLVGETAPYMLANIGGEKEVETDYTAASKIGGDMLEGGITPMPGMTFEDLNRYAALFDRIEDEGGSVVWKNVLQQVDAQKLPYIDEYAEK